MPKAANPATAIKAAVKEALQEALPAQRELLREIFVEALEDFALERAIREGKRSKPISRKKIDGLLAARR
jgi:hypothetical protein